MQRVEKKMRMQLHLQSSELRLRQLRFERRLFEFARAQVLVIKNGVRRDDNERSDDQIDVEAEFPQTVREQLQQMGYKVIQRGHIGRTEVIKIENGKIEAVADGRGDDAAAGY